MTARFSEIRRTEVFATDGLFGKTIDLMIDENSWTVRYIVVKILDGQQTNSKAILIPTETISNFDFESGIIETQLDSSSILNNSPLNPEFLLKERSSSSFRSAAEICDFQIRSTNGKAGTMSDLVINLQEWRVENGVAESNTWLPNASSMFSTNHIDSVDLSNREIIVDLSEEGLTHQLMAFLDSSQSKVLQSSQPSSVNTR